MARKFDDHQPGLTSPASDAKIVTPNDAADLPDGPCRGLYIGTAGNLKVTTLDGTAVDLPDHPAGYAPLRVKRVWATGTGALGIRAMY